MMEGCNISLDIHDYALSPGFTAKLNCNGGGRNPAKEHSESAEACSALLQQSMNDNHAYSLMESHESLKTEDFLENEIVMEYGEDIASLISVNDGQGEIMNGHAEDMLDNGEMYSTTAEHSNSLLLLPDGADAGVISSTPSASHSNLIEELIEDHETESNMDCSLQGVHSDLHESKVSGHLSTIDSVANSNSLIELLKNERYAHKFQEGNENSFSLSTHRNVGNKSLMESNRETICSSTDVSLSNNNTMPSQFTSSAMMSTENIMLNFCGDSSSNISQLPVTIIPTSNGSSVPVIVSANINSLNSAGSQDQLLLLGPMSSSINNSGNKIMQLLSNDEVNVQQSTVAYNAELKGTQFKSLYIKDSLTSNENKSPTGNKGTTLVLPNTYNLKQPSDEINPVGTIKNPIRLVQQGNKFIPMQNITTEQLLQIVQVVQQKSDNPLNNAHNEIFHPETNTRVIYEVKNSLSQSGDGSTPDKPKKKGRKRKQSSLPDVAVEENQSLEFCGAKTRSGRVSRPPKYMRSVYTKYFAASDPSEEKSNDVSPIPGNEISNKGRYTPVPLKVRNYKCSACEKTYLGEKGLARHLKFNPNHDLKSTSTIIAINQSEGTTSAKLPLVDSQMPDGQSDSSSEVSIASCEHQQKAAESCASISPTDDVTESEQSNTLRDHSAILLESSSNLYDAASRKGVKTSQGSSSSSKTRTVGENGKIVNKDTELADVSSSEPAPRSKLPPADNARFKMSKHRSSREHIAFTESSACRMVRLGELMKHCSDEELVEVTLPRLSRIISSWEFLLAQAEDNRQRPSCVSLLHNLIKVIDQVKNYISSGLQKVDQPTQNTITVDDAVFDDLLGLSPGHYMNRPVKKVQCRYRHDKISSKVINKEASLHSVDGKVNKVESAVKLSHEIQMNNLPPEHEHFDKSTSKTNIAQEFDFTSGTFTNNAHKPDEECKGSRGCYFTLINADKNVMKKTCQESIKLRPCSAEPHHHDKTCQANSSQNLSNGDYTAEHSVSQQPLHTSLMTQPICSENGRVLSSHLLTLPRSSTSSVVLMSQSAHHDFLHHKSLPCDAVNNNSGSPSQALNENEHCSSLPVDTSGIDLSTEVRKLNALSKNAVYTEPLNSLSEENSHLKHAVAKSAGIANTDESSMPLCRPPVKHNSASSLLSFIAIAANSPQNKNLPSCDNSGLKYNQFGHPPMVPKSCSTLQQLEPKNKSTTRYILVKSANNSLNLVNKNPHEAALSGSNTLLRHAD